MICNYFPCLDKNRGTVHLRLLSVKLTLMNKNGQKVYVLPDPKNHDK
jgi:hypothetical protein